MFKTLQFPDHVSAQSPASMTMQDAYVHISSPFLRLVHPWSSVCHSSACWRGAAPCGVGTSTSVTVAAAAVPQATFDTYRKSSGLGSQNKVATALQRWGPNRFDVPLPPFGSLLKVSH